MNAIPEISIDLYLMLTILNWPEPKIGRVEFKCLVSFMPQSCLTSLSPFSKSKQSIWVAQHDLHIKMCLETKFYILWIFFTIFLDRYKIIVFGWSGIFWKTDLSVLKRDYICTKLVWCNAGFPVLLIPKSNSWTLSNLFI